MTEHKFGGSWTQQKLDMVSKYLSAYMTIFTSNERARHFATHYVDAFAGTGFRTSSSKKAAASLFSDSEAEEFQEGSVANALASQPPFGKYWFVDRSPQHVQALEHLRSEHAEKSIEIINADANAFLAEWCTKLDWRKNRAVVFLDPYGTQVDWSSIETLASTKAVDLWLLFPVGQAVNRMLTKHEPSDDWSAVLDRMFGATDWRTEFYKKPAQGSLFEDEPVAEKSTNFDAIGQYFVRRLQTVFAAVSPNPCPLYNTRQVPIYLLCFASANPKGAKTALKIADHILRS